MFEHPSDIYCICKDMAPIIASIVFGIATIYYSHVQIKISKQNIRLKFSERSYKDVVKLTNKISTSLDVEEIKKCIEDLGEKLEYIMIVTPRIISLLIDKVIKIGEDKITIINSVEDDFKLLKMEIASQKIILILMDISIQYQKYLGIYSKFGNEDFRNNIWRDLWKSLCSIGDIILRCILYIIPIDYFYIKKTKKERIDYVIGMNFSCDFDEIIERASHKNNK